MTIPELKNLILTQELDDKLEEFLISLVAGQEKVTTVILENIATILNLQSQFYTESSRLLTEESKIYQEFAKNPESINTDKINQAIKLFTDNQKKLKTLLDAKTKTAKITPVE